MRSKSLAILLRNRCRENFGQVPDDPDDGDSVIRVRGVTGMGPGAHGIVIEGERYRFGGWRKIWTAQIIIEKNLEVYVGETHGDVPSNLREMLACALES